MKPRPLPDFSSVPLSFVGPNGDIPAKEIPGHPHYYITDEPRVWRSGRQNKPGYFLKPYSGKTHHGYLLVGIPYPNSTKKNRARRQYLLHRLCAAAWLVRPTDPNRAEINHRVPEKANNVPQNLEWVTRRENMIHAVEHGLREPPERTSKRSEALWRNPEHRRRVMEGNRRYWADPEHLKKASEAAKAQWNRPGYRQRKIEAMRRLWKDPAYRARMVEGIRRGCANT